MDGSLEASISGSSLGARFILIEGDENLDEKASSVSKEESNNLLKTIQNYLKYFCTIMKSFQGLKRNFKLTYTY